ncbi:MAG: YhbY family RNA-binding protein [archaeon]
MKKFQIGKNGLTEQFIQQVRHCFDNSDAVIAKIEILKSACRDKAQAKEMGQKIVDALGPNFDFKLIGYVVTVLKFRKKVREIKKDK